jgi:hypothetical protein
VEETYQNLNAVKEDERVADRVHPNPVEEMVADKGYHSNETMTDFVELEIRSYVSEPDRSISADGSTSSNRCCCRSAGST